MNLFISPSYAKPKPGKITERIIAKYVFFFAIFYTYKFKYFIDMITNYFLYLQKYFSKPKKYLCIPKYLNFFIYIPFLFLKKLQLDYNILK